MTVLVTGASGFLGRNLVRALLSRGETVRALLHRPAAPFTAPNLSWHRHDMTGPTDWAPLLHGVSRVYHLAWATLPQSSNEDPIRDAAINIGGSLSLFEAIRSHSVQRVIFASSGGTVYGAVPFGRAKEDDPKSPLCAYGVSKLSVENYLALYERLWGVRSVVLRLSNPFGPGQDLGRNFGVVATFVAQALARKTCTIFGDGRIARDFIYVDDAIEALLAAGAAEKASGAYNVGAGEGFSIAELVAALEQALGRPVDIAHAPARAFDPPRTVLDASRAAAELNWRPRIAFHEGLDRVLAAARSASGGTG